LATLGASRGILWISKVKQENPGSLTRKPELHEVPGHLCNSGGPKSPKTTPREPTLGGTRGGYPVGHLGGEYHLQRITPGYLGGVARVCPWGYPRVYPGGIPLGDTPGDLLWGVGSYRGAVFPETWSS
jgi:hypothetical protein